MKYFIMFVFLMICCSLAANAYSEEPEIPKNASGCVMLKNNWSVPEKGDSVFFQTVAIFLQTQSPLGLGGDFTYRPKSDYFEYAPYLTLKAGPHFVLAGYSANNAGADFMQVGYWYINNYQGLNLIADLRAYIGLNEKSNSFIDNYLEANYPIIPSLKAGVVVDDTCSLAGKGNSISAGPIIYYDISKSVTIIGRYLHNWNTSHAKTTQSENFRLAIRYSF